MMKEFLLDWEKDTVEGAIPGLVELGFVRDADEFLRLLTQGQVTVEGAAGGGRSGRALYTNDVMKIGSRAQRSVYQVVRERRGRLGAREAGRPGLRPTPGSEIGLPAPKADFRV